MSRMIRTSPLLMAPLALAFFVTSSLEGQGFGKIKMKTVLHRKKPPKVYLLGTAVQVSGSAQDAANQSAAQQLAGMLESELFSQDKRLRPERLAPETVIECDLLHFEVKESHEVKEELRYKKVGEKREWNAKKQAYETKDVRQLVPEQVSYQVIDGSLSVAYHAKSARDGAVLDSDTLNSRFLESYPSGVSTPSPGLVQQRLIQSLTAQIVPRLTPTREGVEVLLPKGKLKDASQLGEAGLWNRMLESLEVMPPFGKDEHEAYRHYGIGLAYEALAYEAEQLETTNKMLEQAAIHYGMAFEGKPDEKYFREPQIRIQDAISQYKKIEYQLASASDSPGLESAGQARLSDKGQLSLDPAMRNQDVISLVQAGLSEEVLINMIRKAEAVAFDLSPDGVLGLLRGKVTNKVIAAMQERDSR